ncbi:MAG: PASTA domain-containing protein [Blastocatellia bacterium]
MLSRFVAKEIIQRLLIAALLAGVFFLSAAVVSYLSIRGRTVEVPSVVGKSKSDAADELQNFGLRIKVTSEVHSDKVDASAVIDQLPAPGSVVKTGQIVRVRVSLGTENRAQK